MPWICKCGWSGTLPQIRVHARINPDHSIHSTVGFQDPETGRIRKTEKSRWMYSKQRSLKHQGNGQAQPDGQAQPVENKEAVLSTLPGQPVLEVKPGKSRTQQAGGVVATAVAPKPGAVVFTLGGLSIEVDPRLLFESYLLYEDLVRRGLLTNSHFTDAIYDAMGYVWKIMVNKPPRIQDGRVITEVQIG